MTIVVYSGRMEATITDAEPAFLVQGGNRLRVWLNEYRQDESFLYITVIVDPKQEDPA